MRSLRPPRWLCPLLAAAVAVAVPAVTLPRLHAVSPWPALLGLAVWTAGKYVLCPLRWHGFSESGRGRRWHTAAYAESELLGLLTPGHIGADLWRVKRLSAVGLQRSSAVAEVGLDRVVGALGAAVFVGLAGTALPVRLLLGVLGAVALGGVALLGVALLRPEWLPRRPLPSLRSLAKGLLLSIGYQASVLALLLGTLHSAGASADPVAVLGALGASNLAGVLPGPQGAGPRDAALVIALVGLGIPTLTAVAAVALKATLAWGPALLLGGGCLLVAKVRRRRSGPALAAA
ncbi:lysylphosphatidylglycerol synthase-like protein [Motilibacter rhizosphaerae]|uniref:Lysylphosphatidylglycerol synthase-like protein n=1 Tax=Motilibacter rhizosphaerae TaxID=598652 RepID=A0A4Q7NFV9_9ACTN|nr:lysylphosphatidylglycerol synthase domain-containing protein [Motilibacter rhizosphaerae]RZS82807.1 lysylphosphatidylglycerol synthase-like protein [Motilibacter rhizosphaerae]